MKRAFLAGARMGAIPMAAVVLAGCGSGSPASRTSSSGTRSTRSATQATRSPTRSTGSSTRSAASSTRSTGLSTRSAASSTQSAASTTSTRRSTQTFELSDCLRAERDATRLAVTAIKDDKAGHSHGGTAALRVDLTTLVGGLRSILPSTAPEGAQLRRTRRALNALEGDDDAEVVRALGRPPAKNLAGLLQRACG